MCQKSEVRIAPFGTPNNGAGAWSRLKWAINRCLLHALLISAILHRKLIWRNCPIGVTAPLALKSPPGVTAPTALTSPHGVTAPMALKCPYRLIAHWCRTPMLNAQLLSALKLRMTHSPLPNLDQKIALSETIDPEKPPPHRAHRYMHRWHKTKSIHQSKFKKYGVNGSIFINGKVARSKIRQNTGCTAGAYGAGGYPPIGGNVSCTLLQVFQVFGTSLTHSLTDKTKEIEF